MKSKKELLSKITLIGSVTSLIIGILLLGCENNTGADKTSLALNGYTLKTDNYTFYANSGQYNQTNINRAEKNYCQVETKISKISREESFLTIQLLKPADCQVNYEIIWDGEVKESYPMQCNLFVHALSKNCNEILNESAIETLIINLEETFKDIDKNKLGDINFMIKDACSFTDIQCMGDCNITVYY